jgi:molybdate transport system substrate-binding protein
MHKIRTYLALVLLLNLVGGQQMAISQQRSRTELTVSAAASLTDAFRVVAKEYQKLHPEVSVTFNFAGSQQLVLQLTEGAPCDVFASANMKQMDVAIEAGTIDSAAVNIFAHNRLVVITPEPNTGDVNSLRDLGKPKLKIILADKSVPVGQYALDFLDKCSHTAVLGSAFKESVLRNVVSYEENVRSVLSKVMLDECDAGIVYTTDAAADTAGRINSISIPDSLNVIADYPIGVVKETRKPKAANEFVSYLLSQSGQSILEKHGFIPAGDSPGRK